MGARFYSAFDYDFNDGRGSFVMSRELFEADYANLIGAEVMLVSIEGNRRDDLMYDGFGTIVTVTGTRPAHDPKYLVVETDLRERHAAADR